MKLGHLECAMHMVCHLPDGRMLSCVLGAEPQVVCG